MKIAKHTQAEAWANMCFERGLAWGSQKPGDRYVSLTGGSLWDSSKTWWRKIAGPFTGRIGLPAFDLGRENVLHYAAVIRQYRAPFLAGYATTIYDFARLLLECKETLKLKAVFTTASHLYPEWANVIRQALDCKVYSYYGCGECNSIGFQCKEGEAYHISEEHVILEVEFDSGQKSLVGTGEAYLTVGDHHCGCGRSLLSIQKLEGRIHEFLYSITGERVASGVSTVTMRYLDGIDEFQVRQDRLDHILIIMVANKPLTEDIFEYIKRSFRHYLGEQVDVEIRLVDNIPRTRANKRRIIVNEMV
jgi:phenylacetate-CoA ligase